ncbi:hypothetical protein C8F01DRAFT_1254035 [Mycena amicta]|nr:hypothetical protein C8F01DRAFT_1254035 [Mycena amicta]
MQRGEPYLDILGLYAMNVNSRPASLTTFYDINCQAHIQGILARNVPRLHLWAHQSVAQTGMSLSHGVSLAHGEGCDWQWRSYKIRTEL